MVYIMKENDICIYSADEIYLIDGALYFSFDEEGVCQVTFDNLTAVPTNRLDDYIEHPDMASDFFSITPIEAEEIIVNWKKRSRSKEKELLHHKREALSSDTINTDDGNMAWAANQVIELVGSYDSQLDEFAFKVYAH